MRILIAGAGIGGLVTALSLHDAGFTDVRVMEASARLRPLGVGINLLPHAVRELTELGLGDEVAETGVATAELAYHNVYGSRIWSEPRGLAAGYKWPQYSVHRGRLLMMLLGAVQERMGPETVRTGMRLTGFQGLRGFQSSRSFREDGGSGNGSDGVVAHFEGPEGPVSESADLLIGADGIHSTVRAQMNPREGAPIWNGMVMWRGTTYAEPFLTGQSMIMASDGSRKFVCYPLSEPDPDTGKALTNWVGEVPLPDRPILDRGNWNREADRSEIREHFGDWRFDWLDVPALIDGATAVYEYSMVDRDPLERWAQSRVTLLGDAAHPMHPVGSNGGSQAIIDARVLAHALATSSDGVEAALARYEELRRPATAAIQTANRQMGPEIVMRIAHQRAPEGFARVDDVMTQDELTSIAEGYKKTAGFHPASLNERASYSVDRQSGDWHRGDVDRHSGDVDRRGVDRHNGDPEHVDRSANPSVPSVDRPFRSVDRSVDRSG